MWSIFHTKLGSLLQWQTVAKYWITDYAAVPASSDRCRTRGDCCFNKEITTMGCWALLQQCMLQMVMMLPLMKAKCNLTLLYALSKESCHLFPTPAEKPPVKQASLSHMITINCECRMPNAQEEMVACDKCNRWYAFTCAGFDVPPPGDWYCKQYSRLNFQRLYTVPLISLLLLLLYMHYFCKCRMSIDSIS